MHQTKKHSHRLESVIAYIGAVQLDNFARKVELVEALTRHIVCRRRTSAFEQCVQQSLNQTLKGETIVLKFAKRVSVST